MALRVVVIALPLLTVIVASGTRSLALNSMISSHAAGKDHLSADAHVTRDPPPTRPKQQMLAQPDG
jgi:hypothetical protein